VSSLEPDVDKFGLGLLGVAGVLYLISVVRVLRAPSVLIFLAFVLHLIGLLLQMFALPARFGFAQALCATLWVSLAVLLYESRTMDLRSLLRVLAPVAALTCALAVLYPGQLLPQAAARPSFVAHLLLGTAAYGVLLMAALHAMLMVSAQRALQSSAEGEGHHFGPLRLIGELPPLMALEKLLFSLIGLGFVLLTLTLLSGTVFSGEVLGRAFRFDHKTLFTLLAWAVFAVLLVGRSLRGWRGRTALRFTLLGFALLLLGYVGSRFVLEVLLGR
jgi:ABC-type uncharacterized transport system permease subunit